MVPSIATYLVLTMVNLWADSLDAGMACMMERCLVFSLVALMGNRKDMKLGQEKKPQKAYQMEKRSVRNSGVT